MSTIESLENHINQADVDFWRLSGRLLNHLKNHPSGFMDLSCEECITFKKKLASNRNFVDVTKQRISIIRKNSHNPEV